MGVTVVQAGITKTGAFDGATIVVEALGAEFELALIVKSFTANAGVVPKASFCFEYDTAAAEDFSTVKPGPVFQIVGQLPVKSATTPPVPIKHIVTQRDFPMLPFGVDHGVLRLTLQDISGAGASIVYEAYIGQG